MYPQSDSPSDIQANIPSMALMFTMYSPTFGNYSFLTQAPQPGQLSDQFPTYPYLSLEALLYMSSASNPQVSPTLIQTGSTSGTQNLVGAQTQSDGAGTTRVLNGYQASTQQLL
jgi:hypothetical protein